MLVQCGSEIVTGVSEALDCCEVQILVLTLQTALEQHGVLLDDLGHHGIVFNDFIRIKEDTTGHMRIEFPLLKVLTWTIKGFSRRALTQPLTWCHLRLLDSLASLPDRID